MQNFTQSHALPGMDFFQSMLKGAGMPGGFASWMAPTLDPDELEQKITDLKAVLQWLEANCRLTQATIQGLEVQRMTLSALKTMNVDMEGLATRMGQAMQDSARAMAEPVEAADPATAAAAEAQATADEKPQTTAAAAAAPGMMDPMQWWSAVSQQFSQVATQALRDNPWPMPASAAAPPPPAAAATTGPTRAKTGARQRTAAKAGATKPKRSPKT